MTWRDLAKAIVHMPSDQLDTDVTVFLFAGGEVHKVCDFVTEWKSKGVGSQNYTDQEMAQGVDSVDGVLDEGHPYITVTN